MEGEHGHGGPSNLLHTCIATQLQVNLGVPEDADEIRLGLLTEKVGLIL